MKNNPTGLNYDLNDVGTIPRNYQYAYRYPYSGCNPKTLNYFRYPHEFVYDPRYPGSVPQHAGLYNATYYGPDPPNTVGNVNNMLNVSQGLPAVVANAPTLFFGGGTSSTPYFNGIHNYGSVSYSPFFGHTLNAVYNNFKSTNPAVVVSSNPRTINSLGLQGPTATSKRNVVRSRTLRS